MQFKRIYVLLCIFVVVLYGKLYSADRDDTYVLVISFDGFRYDYLDRGISPNLKKFADNGVRATSFKPIFPTKTFPSHISIMTGLKAGNHGIIANSFIDPHTSETYKVGSEATKESKWYQGEFFWETASKNGIRAASYFWPGSEINYKERRPHYVEPYEHKRPYEERVAGVVEWLMLPENLRPRFITLYFDATDSYGHEFGTESDSLNYSINMLDNIFGILLNKLDIAGWLNKLNIIVVSDHGMINVDNDKNIAIESLINTDEVIIQNHGPFAMIDPIDPTTKDKIYSQLAKSKNFKTYKKEDLPSRYGLKHNPKVSELYLIAKPGTVFTLEGKNYSAIAAHGWDNEALDMHGIFLAGGPMFKENLKIGMIDALDVFPLLCEMYGIKPSRKVDGNIENIEFILKNK